MSNGLKLVDFCSQNKIAFRQTIDLVRPDRDLRSTPAKANVRMMTLRFRKVSDALNKILRLPKVLKLVFLS